MAELKIHMNSHTMDKVYPCPQCSAVFSRDGTVIIALNIHLIN